MASFSVVLYSVTFLLPEAPYNFIFNNTVLETDFSPLHPTDMVKIEKT